jgi:hypothetical protein
MNVEEKSQKIIIKQIPQQNCCRQAPPLDTKFVGKSMRRNRIFISHGGKTSDFTRDNPGRPVIRQTDIATH